MHLKHKERTLESKNHLTIAIAYVGLAIVFHIAAISCTNGVGAIVDGGVLDSGTSNSSGSNAEDGDKDETPEYDVVFPDGKVNRIDIEIGSADWQAMIDDMKDMYGESGSGNGGPGDSEDSFDDLPEWDLLLEACQGKTAGAACTFRGKGDMVDRVCM